MTVALCGWPSYWSVVPRAPFCPTRNHWRWRRAGAFCPVTELDGRTASSHVRPGGWHERCNELGHDSVTDRNGDETNSSDTRKHLATKRSQVANWYAANEERLTSDDPALGASLALWERLNDAISYLDQRLTARSMARSQRRFSAAFDC